MNYEQAIVLREHSLHCRPVAQMLLDDAIAIIKAGRPENEPARGDPVIGRPRGDPATERPYGSTNTQVMVVRK